MTLRARGRRSSKDASNTNDWISGYDIAAQLAEKGNGEEEGKKMMKTSDKHKVRCNEFHFNVFFIDLGNTK